MVYFFVEDQPQPFVVRVSTARLQMSDEQEQACLSTYEISNFGSLSVDHAQQAVQPQPQQHQHQPHFPGVPYQAQSHPLQPLYSPPFNGAADTISNNPFTIASSNSSNTSGGNHPHHLVPNGPNMSTQEQVRRTSLAAALANGIVSPRASYM
ncbi:hypothetical protein ACJ73_07250 [Blastomyces percursus]|uniref:Velvet domain-containing protein n=1 Tax=Blastomyces percursus TaxID=1658174 RepID=A0A1J9QYX1_9EURO|nr:hypothetical protein ACJ73_07250 [Blastomyces percursus]